MDPGGETQTPQHRQNIVVKDVISLSWSGDRLEGDGPLAVEAGVDDLEELGLLHEVPLDALVDRPVVAGPVLGHHADDEAIRWEKEPDVSWISESRQTPKLGHQVLIVASSFGSHLGWEPGLRARAPDR